MKYWTALLLLFCLATRSYAPVTLGGKTSLAGKTTFGVASTLGNGLVSYWKMDEVSGTRNDSYGANNLADNNTVTSTAGKIGNAGQFTAASSEFLSIADNASFSFTNAFSFSAWVYRPSTVAVNQAIAGKWTYQTDGGWVLQSGAITAADLSFFIATNATDAGTGCRMDFNDANQSIDTWYHLVLIYDGTQTGNDNRLKIYQNGVALTLTATAGAVPASLQNDGAIFKLGSFGGSLTRYWNGYIDEAGLWNRALIADAVALLYNSGSGRTCCPFSP